MTHAADYENFRDDCCFGSLDQGTNARVKRDYEDFNSAVSRGEGRRQRDRLERYRKGPKTGFSEQWRCD